MSIKEPSSIISEYIKLKKKYNDCLLFYRLGDFYEFFFEDAVIVSKELNIVLTKRGKHNGVDVPMSGVPVHRSDEYLMRLVKNGFKIAICEQLETAEEAKKRGKSEKIKRDVVRIVTPGTIVENDYLDGRENNYLGCLVIRDKDNIAFAWLDLSTKKFTCKTLSIETYQSFLMIVSPKEILISDSMNKLFNVAEFCKQNNIFTTIYADNYFAEKRTRDFLLDFYKITSIDSFGFTNNTEIIACGALIEYLSATQMNNVYKFDYPKIFNDLSYLYMDSSAINSLDIFKTSDGKSSGSLLNAIDNTVSDSGSRKLRNWLNFPSLDTYEIEDRLSIVDFFIKNSKLRISISVFLSKIPDLERSLTKILLKNYKVKDLLNIKNFIKMSYEISYIIAEASINNELPIRLQSIYQSTSQYNELYTLLDIALLDDVNFSENSKQVNPNFDITLKSLYDMKNNSSEKISILTDKYRKELGIINLKISSNNLIGFYIEVSANQAIKLVDKHEFIHKQSLATSVRYITKELIDLELSVLRADAEYTKLENSIFIKLCESVLDYSDILFYTSEIISEIDVFISFATLAIKRNYVKPIVSYNNKINIIEGKHPVIEGKIDFIPNDLILDDSKNMILLTGPNMAGKSTYLRQNAIIILMAQIGSFVPAKYAEIGLVDKLFSRVGASDIIYSGKSTFMVEMIEVANILNNATKRSFVILDEIGRGTAFCDGISIANAVLEYIHTKIACRTIFATHYHELCEIEDNLSQLKCCYVFVDDNDSQINFTYSICNGRNNHSYGINVAKLAGLPCDVIERATEIFQKYMKNNMNEMNEKVL